jgi:hypothetical protein
MKTYLTEDEFVEIFWQEMDRKMSAKYAAATGDKIAWNLFQEFEKDIKDTLAGSMYGIEDFDGDNASELIGYQFHKSFRQTDPIDARYLNGIVWTCLQDAPMFWKCMDKACKILVSEDLAEHYKELIEV